MRAIVLMVPMLALPACEVTQPAQRRNARRAVRRTDGPRFDPLHILGQPDGTCGGGSWSMG